MRIAALIVAAGRGTRAGQPGPKQYVPVAGQPILRWTLDHLLAHPRITDLQVVIHADDRRPYRAATPDDLRLHPPVIGGETRSASVRAGLDALVPLRPDIVLIHDAARPFVPPSVVDGLIAALEHAHGACPVLPVVDALWQGADTLDYSVSRDHLLRAQTPQAFQFDAIHAAHRAVLRDLPDDVAIARAEGISVASVPGSEDLFKITTPGDFARAEQYVRQRMDFRTGTGFDVHAFEDGDVVTLCGIDIPHTHKLKGHSDADVAMHTITDALFGAIAEGDIGRWFPPSDPQWKGAASHIFLDKAVERIAARGGRIGNIDCTIICEFPKITPHADAMRAKIAEICKIELDRVSIKATTSERLGFTGRGEGIAAMATATVVLP
ncbi:2-C-methyl-D-erythritol 4-phosphate cytidylyltransferase/2-C-methyl-D-erythritol 2,4-cyclodiphosphate synthase [Rubricella aquisinus]|uniref:Bifunctional enzyme IspD/IspF n=1 Tax=Rubricella aquisinus TaxID=2028108 RepID=A0A840WYN2_9RHOB|nr:bifunctional 2-C-methyl-D-erythritol 4-phosphate cytidylyltransferase/2-C-methyl-D-erythritol 2,4-cyclodiphosphate synthase [Rubricella aquisinus]MBB5514785.1 2-C-methyl-D-erythritol 4-phosphate cytidylyltransferase/2-C-methyl-D-erythritol 2,4-cyclodiphosphate synthase [Rubricella aquisinus]